MRAAIYEPTADEIRTACAIIRAERQELLRKRPNDDETVREDHVSRKTVQRAKSVKEKAVPDIVAAVEAGHVTLRAAEEVAKLPHLLAG